jgi:hypothetical protein
MKHIFFLFALLVSTISFSQELKFPGSSLSITPASEEWDFIDTKEANEMLIHTFKRAPIIDSQERQIVANVSIIQESTNGLDVVTYSAAKRSSMPAFDVEKVFIPKDIKMKYKNGIGYLATYSDQ